MLELESPCLDMTREENNGNVPDEDNLNGESGENQIVVEEEIEAEGAVGGFTPAKTRSGKAPAKSKEPKKSKKKGIARGRGNSVPGTPVVGGVPLAEAELSLRDIPIVTGANRVSAFSFPLPDASDSDDDDDGRELDKLIKQERRRKKRLVQEQQLRELRQGNDELEKQLLTEFSDKSSDKASDKGASKKGQKLPQSFELPSGPYGARSDQDVPRSRRISQVAVLNDLPTLQQYQDRTNPPEIPSLQALRRRGDLQAVVDRQVQEQDLWCHQPEQQTPGNSAGKPGPLVSGRCAKVESGVRIQVVWPHTRLEGRQSNPSFDRLSFPLLIIGELGIISDSRISDTERAFRLKQLVRVCTFLMRDIDWPLIREYHGAYLQAVERAGHWDVDTGELASQFLYNIPRNPVVLPRQYSQGRQGSSVNQQRKQIPPSRPGHWFCLPYNKGVCGSQKISVTTSTSVQTVGQITEKLLNTLKHSATNQC